MPLTDAELEEITAEFDRLTAGGGLRLAVEVRQGPLAAELLHPSSGGIGARLSTRSNCLVRVWRGDALVAEEQIADEPEVIRACATVLAVAASSARIA